jgi:hypothetical protein
MTMSEIKKGDWVYAEAGGEHVFQCSGTRDGILIGGDDWWFKDCCRRLEPLKPCDKLSLGDRVVVIDRSLDNDPGLGTIYRVIEFSAEARRLPIIDAAPFGWIMEFKQLARLPDCAQDERCETSDEKETHRADDVSEYEPLENLDPCYYRESARTIRLSAGYRPIHPNCVCNMISVPICESCATLEKDVRINKNDQPIPYVLNEERCQPSPDDLIPCPHPEWEGIWLAKKEVRRVNWCTGDREFPWGVETVKAGRFATYSCGWVGPKSEGWTMLEPAPRESISGPKLERPRKHGEIKTPWDPWEM